MSERVFWLVTIIYCIVITTNTIGWRRCNRSWGQTIDNWTETIDALTEANRENERLFSENLLLKAHLNVGADEMTVLRDMNGRVLHIHLTKGGVEMYQA